MKDHHCGWWKFGLLLQVAPATLFTYMVLKGTILSTPASGWEFGARLDSARGRGAAGGQEGGDEIGEKVPNCAPCWGRLLPLQPGQHLRTHGMPLMPQRNPKQGLGLAAEAQAMLIGFQCLLTGVYI